jgi:hypothetical protein
MRPPGTDRTTEYARRHNFCRDLGRPAPPTDPIERQWRLLRLMTAWDAISNTIPRSRQEK